MQCAIVGGCRAVGIGIGVHECHDVVVDWKVLRDKLYGLFPPLSDLWFSVFLVWGMQHQYVLNQSGGPDGYKKPSGVMVDTLDVMCSDVVKWVLGGGHVFGHP